VLRNAEQNAHVSGVPIHTHLASNILSKDLAFCVTHRLICSFACAFSYAFNRWQHFLYDTCQITGWRRNSALGPLRKYFVKFLAYDLFGFCFMGRDSLVGVATRYGLDGPGIGSRWGQDFPHSYRPALGPTQPPTQLVPGLTQG
jgi:hypothetical protein